MKNRFLHIIILSFIGLNSCKNQLSDYNTGISDKDIYTFMDFAIADLKISDSVYIKNKPFSLFILEPDRNYFKIVDFTISNLDSDINNKKRIILNTDTTFIKQQNNRLKSGFEWNKGKLGFKNNDDNAMKIDLSLPYFSKDKKMVIIYKSYNDTSAFMVGGWTMLKYVKTETGWTRETTISAQN